MTRTEFKKVVEDILTVGEPGTVISGRLAEELHEAQDHAVAIVKAAEEDKQTHLREELLQNSGPQLRADIKRMLVSYLDEVYYDIHDPQEVAEALLRKFENELTSGDGRHDKGS